MGPNILADTKLAMLNNANIRLDGGRKEGMVDVKKKIFGKSSRLKPHSHIPCSLSTLTWLCRLDGLRSEIPCDTRSSGTDESSYETM